MFTKKITFSLLVLIFIFSICGCNNKVKDTSVHPLNLENLTFTQTEGKNLPQAMVYKTVTVNDKIYAITSGRNPSICKWLFSDESITEETLGEIYEYDPVKVEWVKKTDMTEVKALFGVTAVNGKIYIMGGISDLEPDPFHRIYIGTVEEYDPETNTWTTKAEMTTPRCMVGIASVNNKIYAIAGEMRNNIVEEYDIATDTWTNKSIEMTKENSVDIKECVSTQVINDKIYFLGGYDNGIAVYDPATNTLTKLQGLNTPMAHFGSVVLENTLLVIGGMSQEGVILDSIEQYNIEKDQWETLPDKIISPKWMICAANIENDVYVMGGITNDWDSPAILSDTVEILKFK